MGQVSEWVGGQPAWCVCGWRTSACVLVVYVGFAHFLGGLGEGGREGGAEERRGVYIASCLGHRLFPAGGSSSLVKGGSGNGLLGERRSGWRGGHAGRGDTVHVGGGIGRRSTGGGVGGLRAPSLLSTQWVGVLDRIPGMGWRGGDLSARPKCASPGPEYLYGTVVSGWGNVGAAVREGLGVGTPP